MAIAVIKHQTFLDFVKEIGFPMNHRMNLDKGGFGYITFDKFIRENVEFIEQGDFNSNTDIVLYTASVPTGDLPDHHNHYSLAKVNDQYGDPFGEHAPHLCHVNYLSSINSIMQKYAPVIKSADDGTVLFSEYIRIIASDVPKDTYLGYGITFEITHYNPLRFAYKVESNEYHLEQQDRETGDWVFLRFATMEEIGENFSINEETEEVQLKVKPPVTSDLATLKYFGEN